MQEAYAKLTRGQFEANVLKPRMAKLLNEKQIPEEYIEFFVEGTRILNAGGNVSVEGTKILTGLAVLLAVENFPDKPETIKARKAAASSRESRARAKTINQDVDLKGVK